MIPGVYNVNTAFGYLPETSPLRRLMVDFYVHDGDQSIFSDVNAEDWSSEFPLAVSREFLKRSIEVNDNTYDGVHARVSRNKCH